MSNFVNTFKNKFLKIHKKLIKKKIINNKIDFNKISFEISNDESRGQISTNAVFIYKKYSKLNIEEIIKLIKKELLIFSFINKIESAGPGFINIFFNKEFLIKKLMEIENFRESYGHNKIGKNKNINIEFVSANPTGPLHIAHSRGAVFGDVLSNLLITSGYKVTKEYYINDSGKQIDILGDTLFIRYKQQLGLNNEKLKENHYPGDYLINIANSLILKDSDKWIDSKESKRKEFFKKYVVKEILKIIQKDLRAIGIYFDEFISEKMIIKTKQIESVFKILKKKKLLYNGILDKPKGDINSEWEPRKQLLFNSSKFGDDTDRPFQKSNNDWTYFANDSAYHFYKLKRGFQELINVWGSDHIGYKKRMESIVKVLSNEKVNLNIKICQLIHLKKNNKSIKMSKRTGNFITIKEVVDLVGSDTLRFFMLYRKNDAQLDFDITKVIEKTKDNPIFYIQYAYARSSSLLRNSKKIIKKTNSKNFIDLNLNKYISIYEWKIIVKILSWPNLVETAALSQEPHRIVYYLENLSSLFHTFWNKGKEDIDLRFIDKENVTKTQIRMYWIECMQKVFRSAFKILGISPMNKM